MTNYDKITDYIMTHLQDTGLDWKRPWQRLMNGISTNPINASTGKPYRGGNRLSLGLRASLHEHGDNRFVAFGQCQKMGGMVNEGAKGVPIIAMMSQAEESEEEDGKKKYRPFWKKATVFHVSDTNLEEKGKIIPYADILSTADFLNKGIDFNQEALHFVKNTGAVIEHKFSDSAFFSPLLDKIVMPSKEQFETEIGYFNVLIHELTHWTGHKSRLNRDLGGRYGESKYAFEELIAELGSAFVCGDLNLTYETRENHVAYIQNWLKVLKSEPQMLLKAAAQAENASKYLHKLQEGKPVYTPEPTQLSLVS